MRILFLIIFLYSITCIAQVANSNLVGKKENVKQFAAASVDQDIDQQDPNIDDFYQKGSFLVYDCKARHWVCTRELEYKRCQRHRKNAILDNNLELPCASFDIFKENKDCWKRQQELTDVAKYEQFCSHPNKVENRLTF